VSTRVVSRKLAAEMNESVLSDALVMPSSSGWPVAGFGRASSDASPPGSRSAEGAVVAGVASSAPVAIRTAA